MTITNKKISSILMGIVSIIGLLAVAGCGHGNSANSVDDYKKAAMGSKLSPEEEAKMHAAVQKQQADDAARQAAAPKAPVTPH